MPNEENSPSNSSRLFLSARRRRFDILLGVLVLLFLCGPIVGSLGPTPGGGLTRIVVTSAFTVMLLSAVFAVSQSRKTTTVALLIAVPAVLLHGLGLLVDTGGVRIADNALVICFLGYTIGVVLRFLFTRQRATSDTICAAICVYLLLAVVWANVFSLIEALQPGSFRGVIAEDAETSAFSLYFSLVTLSTLGYGDIVPASPTARTFAAIEAIMGQLYLAVLVARLVGLQIAQSIRSGDAEGD